MTAQPFRRGQVYWARIPNPAGVAVQQSLGTRDPHTAANIADFLRLLDRKREKYAWLLTALAAGRIAVIAAYRAYANDRLAAFITEAERAESDVVLDPWLDRWQRELERVGKPIASERAKYLRQVMTLVQHGAVERASQLDSFAIRSWLTNRHVGQPNRYRAAMSSFCRFLVEAHVLPSNPVALVRAGKERKPRDAYLDPATALTLCQTMPAPFAAFHAFLIVTAIDVNTALDVRVRDLDVDAGVIRARGTKSARRDRTCVVYEVWAPLWSLVVQHLRANPGLPDRLAFEGVTYWRQRAAIREAMAVRQIADYVTKDHRHTCAVALAKAGHTIHEIAHQLGNDPALTARVYAKHIPARAETRTRSATLSATVVREA